MSGLPGATRHGGQVQPQATGPGELVMAPRVDAGAVLAVATDLEQGVAFLVTEDVEVSLPPDRQVHGISWHLAPTPRCAVAGIFLDLVEGAGDLHDADP